MTARSLHTSNTILVWVLPCLVDEVVSQYSITHLRPSVIFHRKHHKKNYTYHSSKSRNMKFVINLPKLISLIIRKL